MAIIMRNGLEADFDPNKMRAGELAIVTDARELHATFAPGDSPKVLLDGEAVPNPETAGTEGQVLALDENGDPEWKSVAANSDNIVSVRDYGAIGNDYDDDTEAIQRCINENPRSTIFFPKGVYRISETIHCRGRNYGGTYLFLGGAVIKANADMTAMFYFDDTYSGNIETAIEGGPFGIFGGRLDGNKHADVCIKNNSWFIEVNNTYMLSFKVAGVLDEGGGLSSYHRIKCDLARTDEAWSEGTTAGIIAGCVDSFFTDVQIQNCHYGVRLRGGGNTFNGCYFFSRTNTTLHPNASMDGYGIYIENDANSAALAEFNNCYFDSNIYAIYSIGTKVWNIALNSCLFYITHDNYFNATKTYLLGGSKNVNLRARGIVCHSSPTCDFLLGRQAYSIENNRNMLIEQNKPNTTINNLFNIVNLDEAYYVLKESDFPTIGTKCKIGGIAVGNTVNRTGVYKLTVTFGENKAESIFSINSNSVFTFQELNSGFIEERFAIIIDTTYQIGDAMTNLQYYPIYLECRHEGLKGFLHVKLEALSFNPASCYLYNDTYRTGTFEIETPFIIETYEPKYNNSEDYILSNLQNADVIKIGTIIATTGNGCFKFEVGYGGSYGEFIIRKVNNTYTLWNGDRYFNTNFFEIVIDQIPVTEGNNTKYGLYLMSKVNNLNGVLRIKVDSLTPYTNFDLLTEYETGTFTFGSPFYIPMKI